MDNQKKVMEQYENSSNLCARLNLHTYNTNKIDWNLWCFEKIHISNNSTVLEVGCGNGIMWQKNRDKIDSSWDITLSDFSQGMINSAKSNIGNDKIKYKVLDIQDIPFGDKSFDVIIARHMLYHVPDINKALSEIRRVLKPGGKFYVSTNGKEHFMELKNLVKNFGNNIEFEPDKYAEKFGVENGQVILKRYFNNVSQEAFDGQIVIDIPEPIIAYIGSAMGNEKENFIEEKQKKFNEFVKNEIDTHCNFKITTKACLFTAM